MKNQTFRSSSFTPVLLAIAGLAVGCGGKPSTGAAPATPASPAPAPGLPPTVPAGSVELLERVAGAPVGSGRLNGKGKRARFLNPCGLAVDPMTGLDFAGDQDGKVIRTLDPEGRTGVLPCRRDGAAEPFERVKALAWDPHAGGLCVLDAGAGSLKRVAADGTVTVVAAGLSQPEALVADPMGNLFVADTGRQRILKLSPQGQVMVLAGPGAADPMAAPLDQPVSLALDGQGTLFVGERDSGNLRRIAHAALLPGSVETLPIQGGLRPSDLLGGGADGLLWAVDEGGQVLFSLDPATGAAQIRAGERGHGGYLKESQARFQGPRSLARSTSGAVLVADSGNHAIRAFSSEGKVRLVAGSPWGGGGAVRSSTPGGLTGFKDPAGLVALSGRLLVADRGNHRLVAVDLARGTLSLLSGTGRKGGQDHDPAHPGVPASFDAPTGLLHRPGPGGAPGILYVTDRQGATLRSLDLGTGAVRTLAGAHGQKGIQDGPGPHARFMGPSGLALDGAGNLLVADAEAHCIWAVAPQGGVERVAGVAGSAGHQDGEAGHARFRRPNGLTLVGDTLYIADTGNHALRTLNLRTGQVGTLAGDPAQPGSLDGQGAAARFRDPRGLCLGPEGGLLVTEGAAGTLRRVSLQGEVTTRVGGASSPRANLLGEVPGALLDPRVVATGPGGEIYLSVPNGIVRMRAKRVGEKRAFVPPYPETIAEAGSLTPTPVPTPVPTPTPTPVPAPSPAPANVHGIRFACLSNRTAIEARVSDHEPFASIRGILTANISTQMTASSTRTNNGFGLNESPAAYRARLVKVAEMIQELTTKASVGIITLQEVPDPSTQREAYAVLMTELQTRLGDFNLDQALYRRTEGAFGQLILCRRSLAMEDVTSEVDGHAPTGHDQFGRVLAADVYGDEGGQTVRKGRIASVHFRSEAPMVTKLLPTSATCALTRTLLGAGFDLAGDFNRTTSQFFAITSLGAALGSDLLTPPANNVSFIGGNSVPQQVDAIAYALTRPPLVLTRPLATPANLRPAWVAPATATP